MDVGSTDAWSSDFRQLGTPLVEFRSGTMQHGVRLVGGILGTLLGLICMGFGIYLLFDGGAIRFGFHKGLFIGFVLLSGGIATLLRAVRAGKQRVYVFADGLAQLQGSHAEVLRWEDINEVRRNPHVKTKGLTLSTPQQVTLVLRDGRRLVFDESLDRLGELCTQIEEHTRSFMLNALAVALQQGEAIAFGPVAVSSDGILHGDQLLPWPECLSVKVGASSLIVQRKGAKRPFCKVSLEEVPNVHVLAALAERRIDPRV